MTGVQKIDGMPELREDIREHMYDCLPQWLYYRNAPGGRDWWCMRCGASDMIRPGKMRTVTPEMRSVMAARHKGTARCPACGRSAEAICLGRVRDAQRYYRGLGFLVFYAPAPGDVWVVRYLCSYNPAEFGTDCKGKCGYHMKPDARPRVDALEAWHMQPGRADGWWRAYTDRDWLEHTDRRISHRWDMPMPGTGYSKGLGSEIILADDPAGTFLRWSGWEDYARGRELTSAMYYPVYLANAAMYPIAEKLCKAGFREAVQELVEARKANSSLINWHARDIFSALGVNRSELKMLRGDSGQADMDYYRAYRRAKKSGDRRPEEAARLTVIYEPYYNKKHMDDILRAAGITRIDLYRYLDAHKGKKPAYMIRQIWMDYANAAKNCGYDMAQRAVILPRDVHQAHDDAVALDLRLHPRTVYGLVTKVTDELREAFARRAPVLARRFARTGAEYYIRIPQTPEEIIAEGQALRHCVGGYCYIKNHADGRNPILFLRRVSDPDTPWYTMEISASDGKILQCEGKPSEDGHGKYGHVHRDDLPSDAQEFLAAWEADEMDQFKKEKNKGENAS